MEATGAAKRGASRGESEGPGDMKAGTLCRCPNGLLGRLSRYRESETKRERCVGAVKSRVEEVSPAERDASRGGSDLPNRVGQVIELAKKTREMKRRRGAETKVKRPMERSGSRVGQRAGAEGGRRKGRGRGTRRDENAGTRNGSRTSETRLTKTRVPGSLRPGLNKGEKR